MSIESRSESLSGSQSLSEFDEYLDPDADCGPDTDSDPDKIGKNRQREINIAVDLGIRVYLRNRPA